MTPPKSEASTNRLLQSSITRENSQFLLAAITEDVTAMKLSPGRQEKEGSSELEAVVIEAQVYGK